MTISLQQVEKTTAFSNGKYRKRNEKRYFSLLIKDQKLFSFKLHVVEPLEKDTI